MLPGIMNPLLLASRPVVPGSISFNTAGTYTFSTVDLLYNQMTLQVYGAGGGGGVYPGSGGVIGTDGGTSSATIDSGVVQATGGAGGRVATSPSLSPTVGGTGSGPAGTVSLTGGSGQQTVSNQASIGGAGAGPEGGAGAVGYVAGSPYGGGGGGYATQSGGGNNRWITGGAGGGYASYTASYTEIPDTITIVVGLGGVASGGVRGASGGVKLNWF